MDDFMAGLFAGLARRNVSTVSTKDPAFYRSVKAGFEKLREVLGANKSDIRLDFRVFLDPLYGDSAVVRQALGSSSQQRLVSFDNPEFVDARMKFVHQEADEILEHLPGLPEWYDQVAEAFLAEQRAVRT